MVVVADFGEIDAVENETKEVSSCFPEQGDGILDVFHGGLFGLHHQDQSVGKALEGGRFTQAEHGRTVENDAVVAGAPLLNEECKRLLAEHFGGALNDRTAWNRVEIFLAGAEDGRPRGDLTGKHVGHALAVIQFQKDVLTTPPKVAIDEEDPFSHRVISPGEVGRLSGLSFLRAGAGDQDHLRGNPLVAGIQADIRPDHAETFEKEIGGLRSLRR